MAETKADYNKARNLHRKLERSHKAKSSVQRDETLNAKDLSPIFASVIDKLTVGDKVYVGDSVQNDFFDFISNLKTKDLSSLQTLKQFMDFSEDYLNIIKICKHGPSIPPISEKRLFNILQNVKPNFIDFYVVTVNHYNNAGVC